jgi:alkanesulfonate monooxygenase SsuD/methylene tetrahydromethanopterin reductase-like flavin-dependent oxidoreductase (luciferase family)
MFDREGAATPGDVAIVGSRNEVNDKLSEMAQAGATDFAVSEFTRNPKEKEETRALIVERARVS